MSFKRFYFIVIAVLLVVSLTQAAWAATIPVTFSNEGVKYVHSSFPEDINSGTGDHYTIEQSLNAGTTYDMEFYHHNYTYSEKKFGIALYNPNSNAATITINALVKNTSSPIDESTEISMTAPLLEQYALGYGSGSITVPANGWTFLINQNVPNNKLIYAKTKINSNLGGVRARIFHAPTTITASEVFAGTFTRDTADGANGIIAAAFNSDGKYNSSTINASTYPTFILSEHPASTNISEYQTGTNVLSSNGNTKLYGNYGVTYRITVNNAAGKRLKITPNWAGATAADIVLYSPSIGWFRPGKITSGSWYMSMGSSSSFTFKYILPGSNWGNMKFEVID